MVNLEDAHAVAKIIKSRSSYIREVELFGSVAKSGQGRDLDFMLVVDQDLANKFWSVSTDINPKLSPRLLFMRRLTKKFLPFVDKALTHNRKQIRNLRVCNLLNLDLMKIGEEFRPGVEVDAWLVPVDWQSKIDDFTSNSYMSGFFKLAARQAIRIS